MQPERGKEVNFLTINQPANGSLGIYLSALGGLSSFFMGILFPLLFTIFDAITKSIFQVLLSVGGVIAIIGAIVAVKNPADGRLVVLVGAILGGGNILTLAGGAQISLNYARSLGIHRSQVSADKPVLPESTLGWIIGRHSQARVEGRPAPTWEELSLQYREEYGRGPTASQMERLFATWQKIKEKKQTSLEDAPGALH